ncbi:hypothetical protein NIES4074_19470 [Cylindrospermum sp. NIES-4074]|nr:hypothetical protein NIES4074_19470 [Cylindrospermum sp. NIES-4074]
MLFFIIAWLALILICLVIGTGILNLVRADCFERIGDRFIVAVWLGVVILAVSLLAISLILPLSPLVSGVIAIIFATLALGSLHTRQEIIALLSFLSLKKIWGFLALEIGVAAYTARVITWYDTGLYHFQVIRWLSRFGAVPGLALIHHRFGFTSSWFTLAAPFNTGIFEARSSAITGGFAFLLAILQFLISITRILKHQERFEDWFVFFFSFLCLPIISNWAMPVSPSPDLPLILLTGVVTWTFIVISHTTRNTYKNSILEPRIIPVVLSAGTATMKLSALPIVILAGLFYLFERRFNFQRILIGGAITFVLLLPMLSFGVITSGCPLFPSSLLCLNLPWSLGAERAKEVTEVIQNWARWSGPTPVYANSWNWLWNWINTERQSTFLIICSILSAIVLVRKSKDSKLYAQKYVIALSLLGIVYMMYGAPSLRFGLGYLCLLPAFIMAMYSQIGYPPIAPLLILSLTSYLSFTPNLSLGPSQIAFSLLGTTILIYFLLNFYENKISINICASILSFWVLILILNNFIVNESNQIYIWLPPSIEKQIKVLKKESNELTYFNPDYIKTNNGMVKDDRCWAAELPCTPELLINIKLRNPKRGIGAGFITEK